MEPRTCCRRPTRVADVRSVTVKQSLRYFKNRKRESVRNRRGGNFRLWRASETSQCSLTVAALKGETAALQLLPCARLRLLPGQSGSQRADGGGQEHTGVVAVLARGADGQARDGRRDARCSGGSEQMMSEMSFSGRDSIPQEGAPGSRNARVRRAVRISSIVAQEVSRVGSLLFAEKRGKDVLVLESSSVDSVQ